MSARDYWSTPKDFFHLVDTVFKPTLDVCATPENAKCETYITEEDNALEFETWRSTFINLREVVIHRTAWMNPPYSNLATWTEAAKRQTREPGFRVVALLPCDPSTEWFRENVLAGCSQIFLLAPRIQFDVPQGIKRSSNPWPSMLCIFEKSLVPAQILHWHWKKRLKVVPKTNEEKEEKNASPS